MDLRLAENSDLPQIQAMYKAIIEHMNKNNLQIWNEIYPCEFFQEDIDQGSLYILTEGHDIVAAFALCETNDGENYLKWKTVSKKALYIDRLGVNVNYLRQGIGRSMLKSARDLAKRKGAACLRLFVVEINQPAINLYLATGFTRADGIYEERIDDIVLRQYGFEADV